MEISLVIPAKGTSERVHNKNLYKINGKSLVRRACEKVLKCKNINRVYLDTEDEAIIQDCKDLGIGIIKRPKQLATNKIGANELMMFALHSIPRTDLLLQTFATSPLLTSETIDRIVEDFITKKEHDSFFTVEIAREYFWDEKGPMNFSVSTLPNSQQLNLIYRETHGLYGIYTDALFELKRRVGDSPKLYDVSRIEGLDIDTEEDLKIVEALICMQE